MNLTKFEHSYMDITEAGDRLVIDPGVFSPSMTDFAGITALVVTHVHADHFDLDKVNKIIAANPAVAIFTTQEVSDQIKSSLVTVPEVNKQFSVGKLTLEFFGGQHAVIHPSYPTNQNYGVLVNDKFYHPGDSLTICPKPHQVVAVPIMAPWLKFSETADFVPTLSATRFFPAHNGFINEDGQALYNRYLNMVAKATGKTYEPLTTGQSIDI